jgi:RimJ/RimL family protein N-acetyltransferase
MWQPELQNAIIKLSPLLETDFDRLFAIASDPKIWEQHPTKERYRKEVFHLYFDGAVKSQSAFLVFDQLSNELIGCTRYYDSRPEQRSVAIGYTFLSRRYWGGQYNSAMKSLMLINAFKFVDTVFFHVGATNIRSQKAVMKLGANKVKEVDFDYYGKKLLHFEYSLTKDLFSQLYHTVK